jgi:hypothetical protein
VRNGRKAVSDRGQESSGGVSGVSDAAVSRGKSRAGRDTDSHRNSKETRANARNSSYARMIVWDQEGDWRSADR